MIKIDLRQKDEKYRITVQILLNSRAKKHKFKKKLENYFIENTK